MIEFNLINFEKAMNETGADCVKARHAQAADWEFVRGTRVIRYRECHRGNKPIEKAYSIFCFENDKPLHQSFMYPKTIKSCVEWMMKR